MIASHGRGRAAPPGAVDAAGRRAAVVAAARAGRGRRGPVERAAAAFRRPPALVFDSGLALLQSPLVFGFNSTPRLLSVLLMLLSLSYQVAGGK